MGQALEANQQLAALVERQQEENARLREELAGRDGELERVNAELAVLQRMLFGRSSNGPRPGRAVVTARLTLGPVAPGRPGRGGPGARAGLGLP